MVRGESANVTQGFRLGNGNGARSARGPRFPKFSNEPIFPLNPNFRPSITNVHRTVANSTFRPNLSQVHHDSLARSAEIRCLQPEKSTPASDLLAAGTTGRPPGSGRPDRDHPYRRTGRAKQRERPAIAA